jgi:hypothetical protein
MSLGTLVVKGTPSTVAGPGSYTNTLVAAAGYLGTSRFCPDVVLKQTNGFESERDFRAGGGGCCSGQVVFMLQWGYFLIWINGVSTVAVSEQI